MLTLLILLHCWLEARSFAAPRPLSVFCQRPASSYTRTYTKEGQSKACTLCSLAAACSIAGSLARSLLSLARTFLPSLSPLPQFADRNRAESWPLHCVRTRNERGRASEEATCDLRASGPAKNCVVPTLHSPKEALPLWPDASSRSPARPLALAIYPGLLLHGAGGKACMYST